MVKMPTREEIIDTHYCATTRKLVVELASYTDIRNLSPNFDQLTKINFGEYNVRGIIVTTRGGSDPAVAQYDFCSRYFAPWVGINEDPVTGDSH